jgi:hypothetical protein
LDYIALITRGSENVNNTIVKAGNEADAFEQTKVWAASLGLASDDDVLLSIKLPNGSLKTFARKDF